MHRNPVKREQTIAPNSYGVLRLPVLQVSPYFSMGRGASKTTVMAKAKVIGFNVNQNPGASIMVWNDSNVYFGCFDEHADIAITDVTTDALKAAIVASTKAGLQSDTGFTFADSDYSFLHSFFGARTFANPSLAVNTSRQASAAQDAQVSASVDITSALSLSGGQSGKVELKYADDSGFTTNVVTVQGTSNGNTGTLAIGLGITQLCTATVTGLIPAGKYYRLVTTNITGTPTYGTPVIQEVLL